LKLTHCPCRFFIQPENILIDKSGKTLKLADFGSCRSVHSKPPFTEYIATRWYRSPECLLTEGFYGAPMDIWGAGCVLFEIISLFPLFPGADEVDQVNRIHKVVGTPTGEILAKLKKHKSSKIDFKFRAQNGVGIKHFIPHASVECVNLLTQTLEYDFGKRIGSAEACSHEYFGALRGDVKKKIDPTKKRPNQRVNGKEARNEKSALRRKKQQQTGEITEEKPKVKKFVRAEKKQPYTRNNIAKVSHFGVHISYTIICIYMTMY
jgi:serine/threonine protein kinase